MLKNFICPNKAITPIEVCLKKCPFGERCATISFLTLCADERQWNGKPSVTQLIRGTREAYLKITCDYSEDPQDQVFRVIGSKGHSSLEKHGLHPEERIEFEGITGIPDEIEDENEIILIDNKITGSYRVMLVLGMDVSDAGTGEFFKNGKEKTRKTYTENPEKSVFSNIYDEWILQTNMYRIMFESKTGKHVDKIKVMMFVRDGGTTSAKTRGIDKNFRYVEAPIIDDKIILEYFRKKRDDLLSALKTNTVPEPCTPEEAWNGNKCKNYCSVVDFCDCPYLD